jgi:hypothetical protein
MTLLLLCQVIIIINNNDYDITFMSSVTLFIGLFVRKENFIVIHHQLYQVVNLCILSKFT